MDQRLAAQLQEIIWAVVRVTVVVCRICKSVSSQKELTHARITSRLPYQAL
jgi:hypothetical protein